MSFREETASLAVDLSQLVTSRSSRNLDPDGLAIALLARRDTLRLLRQILLTATGQPRTAAPRDRTGTGTTPASPSISFLEARPVAALLLTLSTVPLPTTLSEDVHPSVDPTVGSIPGLHARTAWGGVRRHAVLAEHEWSERAPTPTGDARWSAVADVAAMTRAVTILDHDLLAAARTHPGTDPDVVEGLTRATVSGLRLAATEAGSMAALGQLPDWQKPGPELHPTRVIVVRSPEHIIAAQKRLAALIMTTDALGPHAVDQLVKGQTRFLVAAAGALAGVDPTRAHQAATLADALRNSLRSGPHALVSLTPDDARPIIQTRAVLMAVAVAGTRGWASPDAQPYLPALAGGTDAARDVITALAGHARSSLYSGHWLIPNKAETAGDYKWRRAQPKEWVGPRRPLARQNAPRLLQALETVAALSESLKQPGPLPQIAGTKIAPPREILATMTTAIQNRPSSLTASPTNHDQNVTLTTLRESTYPPATTDHAAVASHPTTPPQRWAALAEQLDPRLTQAPDWAVTASALQLAHDHGVDVPTVTREVLTRAPLGDHPAQDLRYRLAPLLDLPVRGAPGRATGNPPGEAGTARGPISDPDTSPGGPGSNTRVVSAGARTAERQPRPAETPATGTPQAR